MSVDQKRIVTLALAKLEEEKKHLDAEIAQLRFQLKAKSSARKDRASATKPRKASVTRSRTARQKAKSAAAMKKLWEKVRKAGFSNIKDYKASLSKS